MSTILIDADILLYRTLSSTEREVEFDTDQYILATDLSDAREAFESSITNIVDASPLKDYKLVFSDTRNFRKELYSTYKGNRVNVRKPMCYREFRLEMIEKYSGIVKPTLEADDVIGILISKPNSAFVCWSIDKDLKTVPGKHLSNNEIIGITEPEADYMFYLQCLMGDVTDGYPGCKGIGKVKAEKIIDKAIADGGDVWQAIVDTYAKAELDADFALAQARQARILRFNDWDGSKQEVKLWTPN